MKVIKRMNKKILFILLSSIIIFAGIGIHETCKPKLLENNFTQQENDFLLKDIDVLIGLEDTINLYIDTIESPYTYLYFNNYPGNYDKMLSNINRVVYNLYSLYSNYKTTKPPKVFRRSYQVMLDALQQYNEVGKLIEKGYLTKDFDYLKESLTPYNKGYELFSQRNKIRDEELAIISKKRRRK